MSALSFHDRMLRWFPFLAWPRPSGTLLTGELAAGVTVALMLLPQAVAYAALAGMPLVTGIYASLLPALVAVLWGASPRLGVGPTALTSLIVGASLTGLAVPASAQWVALAVWLALLSGLAQLVLGLGGFGWLLNLVSVPVMTGFTQAAAWLIMGSQVPAFLGQAGGISALLSQPAADPAALAFGAGALLALLLGKRWRPDLPAVIVVVTGSAAISWATGFAARGGAVVGSLPRDLPALAWPTALPAALLIELVLPALVITLMSFLEAASSAKVEHQRAGTRWNENQDLVGQGLGKIAAGLCGAFPISASFSRSAITLYAGARTGWATVFAILLVLAALLWLTPALYHVPRAVLAAVVIAAVLGLVEPSAFRRLWRISRVEATIGLATFALTLATAPRLYWGVLAGLLMALSHFLYQRLHPRIVEVGLHADGSLRDRNLWGLPPLGPRLYALRMDAELDFASADALERTIALQLAARPDVARVALFAQPINRIDVTGADAFAALARMLNGRGIALHLVGLKLPVDTLLRRAGMLQEGPLLHTWRTDAEAIAALAADATPKSPD